jgi:hypothetical protein
MIATLSPFTLLGFFVWTVVFVVAAMLCILVVAVADELVWKARERRRIAEAARTLRLVNRGAGKPDA